MISVSVSVDVPNLAEGVRSTPVHIDLHVDDFKASLARAIAAGAKQEQLFENAKHPAAAFCSDPFGHGFCLIERRPKK